LGVPVDDGVGYASRMKFTSLLSRYVYGPEPLNTAKLNTDRKSVGADRYGLPEVNVPVTFLRSAGN